MILFFIGAEAEAFRVKILVCCADFFEKKTKIKEREFLIEFNFCKILIIDIRSTLR